MLKGKNNKYQLFQQPCHWLNANTPNIIHEEPINLRNHLFDIPPSPNRYENAPTQAIFNDAIN